MHGDVSLDQTRREEAEQADLPSAERVNGFGCIQTRILLQVPLQAMENISDEQGPDARTDGGKQCVALQGTAAASA